MRGAVESAAANVTFKSKRIARLNISNLRSAVQRPRNDLSVSGEVTECGLLSKATNISSIMLSKKQSNQRLVLPTKAPAQPPARRTYKDTTEDLQIKRNLSARKIALTAKIAPAIHAQTPRNATQKYTELSEKHSGSNIWGRKTSFQKSKGDSELVLKSDRMVTPPASQTAKRMQRSKSRHKLGIDNLREPVESRFISLRQITPTLETEKPILFEPVVESANESLTESIIARDFVGIKDSLEVEKEQLQQPALIKRTPPAVFDNLRLNFRKSGTETTKKRPASPIQTNLVDVNLSSYNCMEDPPYSPILSRNHDQLNFDTVLLDNSVNSTEPRRFNLCLKPAEISNVEDIETDPTLRFQEPPKLSPPPLLRYEERREDFVRDVSEKFEELDRLISQIEAAKGIDLGISKSVLRSEFVKIYSQL